MTFDVASGKNLTELVFNVNQLLSRGYTLYGQLVVVVQYAHDKVFYQGVVSEH